MKLDLSITQTQKLAMTQEMRQAIEILQMTSTELNTLIEKETTENPLLEFYETPIKGDVGSSGDQKKDQKDDSVQWDEYFRDIQSHPVIGQSTGAKDEEEFGFEKFSFQEKTLHEYLHFQFSILKVQLSERQGIIGEYLIDCIDDNGYLVIDETYILENLKIEEQELDVVVTLIQTLDPEGVGARNIGECLKIQLINRGYEKDGIYIQLVDQYLKELAEHHYRKIEKEMGLTLEEISEFKSVLKTLEPKPGRKFSSVESVSYVIPDGSIEIVNGELRVKISEVSAPQLHISTFYQNLLKQQNKNSEAREYLSKKMEGAVFLIKSIEQRRQTIKKVIESIALYQRDFFFDPKTGLKALTLKNIADEIGMHESTVSRAIRGKYVETPNGTLPLKFFFKRGFSDGSEERSSEAIKNLIKELIDKEDKKKPLSDQKIAQILKEQNLDVARRTVAKYREEMMIESSSKRKEYLD